MDFAGQENVLIQAGDCSVVILPQLGGKIASVRVKGFELLQAPLAPYAPRTRTMGFEEGDASGWDECLPSVAGCTVETAAGEVSVPDHGDLWRVAWTPLASSANSCALQGSCFSLPLILERTATLTETEEGYRLSLDYKLTNTGSSETPWAWSAHPSFAAEEGDFLVLPDSITELTLEGSGGGRLGQKGDTVNWPIATTVDGDPADLSVAYPPHSGFGDKLFAGPLATSENWCALERPSAGGIRIRVTFDPAKTPYLGLWICHGGWPDRPGAKQTCVAMEPTTAPVDSLAIGGPWSRTLAPGETYHWPMTVDFETL